MHKIRRYGLVLTALLVTGQAAEAQRPRRQGSARPRVPVEALLRSHERLELSSDQIKALEALQEETIAQRRQVQDLMRDLRSQVRAGDLTREQARERIEETAGENRESRKALQERVRGVLTDEQLAKVNRARQAQARMRGPARPGQRAFRRGRGGNRPGAFGRSRGRVGRPAIGGRLRFNRFGPPGRRFRRGG